MSNIMHVYLDTSKLELKHVAGGGLDKDSRKQLCVGFYLVSVETT